jgi:hypothetical protein
MVAPTERTTLLPSSSTPTTSESQRNWLKKTLFKSAAAPLAAVILLVIIGVSFIVAAVGFTHKNNEMPVLLSAINDETTSKDYSDDYMNRNIYVKHDDHYYHAWVSSASSD